MNEIQVFNHEEFGEIRTIEIDGQIYFVGCDIANVLGYANASKALKDYVDPVDKKVLTKSFCKDFLKFQNVTLEDFPNRGLSIINENGLYSLVLASKLQRTKKFKHWVTSEILPEIRKTGSYNPNPPKIEHNQIFF